MHGSTQRLERRLAAMHAGPLDSDTLMGELLGAQVFMPVKDSGHRIANFRASQKAEPCRWRPKTAPRC